MIVADRDEPTNLMDELRTVQLLLKREHRFVSFYEQELSHLTSALTQTSHRVHCIQKFHLFLAMSSLNNQVFDQAFLTSLFSEGIDSSVKIPGAMSPHTPIYNDIISAFLADLPRLAQACVNITHLNPAFIDEMAFQTLPDFLDTSGILNPRIVISHF
jgi:hypothetical protein